MLLRQLCPGNNFLTQIRENTDSFGKNRGNCAMLRQILKVASTHHGVTDLVNDEIVRNTKT